MLPQPSVVIEAMKLLISPGNLAISKKDSEKKSGDSLDIILENSLKDYTEKINTDAKFSGLNVFELERKPRYFPPEANLKWKFASTCLILIEALTTSLQEASIREKQTKSEHNSGKVKSNKKKPVAPRLPADALSIEQQKVFINTMQFILCLGVYPHLAKGVGIPLERRSGYGLLLTSSVSDIQSILERQYRLVLIARVFSACLNITSVSSLFLSRYLGDCLAVMFQLCYGVKKSNVPKSTPESNTCPKSDTKIPDNENLNCDSANKDHQAKTVEPSETPKNTASVSTNTSFLSSNNNSQVTSTYHVAITEEDMEFCKTFLENLKRRSYQPSLVKELLLLQGGPGSKVIKSLQQNNPQATAISSNLNLPPAPVWLKNACSQSLNKILLSKPNGINHIIQGMLDAPVNSKTDEVQDYQKYYGIARVIAICPPTVATDDEYYKQTSPQVMNLIRDSHNDQFHQMLRVACCVMNLVSNKNPSLFQKYFLKKLLAPLYSCIEYMHDSSTESGLIVADEFQLNTCIEDIHKVFVCGSEPQADLLNQLRPFVYIIFSVFSYTDMTSSHVQSLTEEILLAYLKFADIDVALMCLRIFTFGSLSKNWNFGVHLMHPMLTFTVGDNDCPRVITKPQGDTSDEELDLLCDESERIASLLNLVCKLNKEELTEKFLIYMLQELTRTLDSEMTSDSTYENESSETSCTELLDIEKKQEENRDQVFYQLTILNLLAAVFEKLGPSSLKSTKHVLEFIKATLVKSIDELDPVEKEFGGIFNNEILTMSLGMLTAVVAGALQITDEDQKTLTSFIPLLQNVIVTTNNSSIKAMASSLRVAISTYGKVWPEMDFADVYKSEFKQENPHQLITELSDNLYAEKFPRNEATATKDSRVSSKKSKKSGKKQSVSAASNSSSKPSPSNKDAAEGVSLPKDLLSESPNGRTDLKQTVQFTKSPDISKGKVSAPQDTKSKISKHSKLQDALKETYDPLIPVQGHGLITLTKLIQNNDKETVKKQDLILHVFEEKLTHPDSYIYLSAVNGLAAMADNFPEKVIPRLIDLFRDPESEIQNAEAIPSEMKIKLGESIVKASRSLGPIIPKYRDILLGAFLQGAKDTDPLVRASSLSNLGEACKQLHFSLGNVIHEIFSCCSSLAKSDPSIEVRAAAVLLITQLLQGLGKDALQVLEFVMKDLYQLLKSIINLEKEEQVKLHANLALNELDNIMRETLFPKQNLTKKIRVLDPE